MTLTAVLLLSLLFVALNGLFVSAEFALIASPRPSLERRSSQGDSLARRVLASLAFPVSTRTLRACLRAISKPDDDVPAMDRRGRTT